MIECPNCHLLYRETDLEIEMYICLGPNHADQGLIVGHHIRQNTKDQIIIVQELDGKHYHESHLKKSVGNFACGAQLRSHGLAMARKMGLTEEMT